jgi:hypothetical protein
MADFEVSIDLLAMDHVSAVVNQTESELSQLDKLQQQNVETTKEMVNAGGQAKSSFEQLTGSLQGMLVAYAGVQGVQLVGKLIEQGTEANVVEARFRSLTASMGDYNALMAGLESASGGATGEMELQAQAAQVMSMNLASNKQQLMDIVGLADSLGDAVNYSGDAVTTFANALASGSGRALKEFGIDIEAVKERMKELESQGYSTNDAFKMAAIEQAKITLQGVGDAAGIADSNLRVLNTRVHDLIENFSQNLSIGANSLIGILMHIGEPGFGEGLRHAIALEINPELGKAEALQAQVQDLTNQITPMIVKGLELTGSNLNPFADFVRQALADVANDPSLASDTAALTTKVLQQMNMTADQLFKEGGMAAGDMFNSLSNEQVLQQASAGILQYQNTIQTDMARANQAAVETSQDNIIDYTKNYWDAYNRQFASQADSAQQARWAVWQGVAQRDAQQLGDAWRAAAAQAPMTDLMRQQMEATGSLAQFMGEGGMVQGVGALASQEQADALKQKYEELAGAFKQLQDMNKEGLISDDELTAASDLKEHVKGVADEAQRAADAFQNMKLSDVFGQTGGGLAGQVSNAVLDQMQKAGKSDAEIAAAAKAMGLASGTQTAASIAFQEQIVPMLANMNPTDMAKAMMNLQAFMQQGELAGLTPDQIAKGLPLATGFAQGGGKGSFSIKAGQSAGEIMAATGMTLPELLAATGAKSDRTIPIGTFGAPGGYSASAGFDLNALISSLLGGGLAMGGGAKSSGAELEGLGGMAGQNLLGKGGAGQEVFRNVQDQFADISTSVDVVSGKAGVMYEEFGKTTAELDRIKQSMDGIATSKKVELEVVLTGDGAYLLKSGGVVVGGGAAAPGTSTTTIRDNGGKVVGVSPQHKR